MKIRNGFVSNSSSSSFIVAFPRKPKNEDELFEFMFGNDDKDSKLTWLDDNYSMIKRDIAAIVFNDLLKNKFKKLSKKAMVDELSGRYFYYSKSKNCFWIGQTSDKDGGSWLESIGRYYCSDTKLANIIKSLQIENDNAHDVYWKKHHSIIKEFGPKMPEKRLYKCEKTKFTKDEEKLIKLTKKYEKELDDFVGNDSRIKEIKTPYYEFYRKNNDESYKARIEMAKIDGQNFLDDNKGKFIALLTYSDHDNALLENGGIFNNLNHIRISNH